MKIAPRLIRHRVGIAVSQGFALVSLATISSSLTLVTALPAYSQIITPHIEGPPRHSEEKKGEKIIALLPEQNVFAQKKRYLRLQNYLSKRLDMKIYFKIIARYPEIFGELRNKTVDGAFFGSMGGTMAQVEGLVEMLARPVWLNGVSTYNGYIFARKGSGISSDPATWKGKKVAFVSKVTTAGFLFPLSVVRAAGIETDLEAYFNRVVFAGSHDAAILAVLRRQVDIGASKNTVYDEYRRLHPKNMKDLNIILRSRHVPSNGLGMRPDVPAELKQRIKKTLLGMDKDPKGQKILKRFGAVGFIETTLKDYQPVVDMADTVGIDLHKWSLEEFR
jgi:phosphonate transport system substrate-binding protein